MFSPMQNISFLGMVRKISGNAAYSDLWLIVPGLVLFFLPYLRISRYGDKRFQMLLLSSVLLFTVLFSTGSESSTYIIPFTGVVIWFLVTPERHGWKYSNLALLLFALIFTGFSSSDLFPRFIRMEYIRPYALKALPCMIVWLFVIYDMCKGKFVSNYRNK